MKKKIHIYIYLSSRQIKNHFFLWLDCGQTHLNTVERSHTHVEEHAIEHRHGDELGDTQIKGGIQSPHTEHRQGIVSSGWAAKRIIRNFSVSSGLRQWRPRGIPLLICILKARHRELVQGSCSTGLLVCSVSDTGNCITWTIMEFRSLSKLFFSLIGTKCDSTRLSVQTRLALLEMSTWGSSNTSYSDGFAFFRFFFFFFFCLAA